MPQPGKCAPRCDERWSRGVRCDYGPSRLVWVLPDLEEDGYATWAGVVLNELGDELGDKWTILRAEDAPEATPYLRTSTPSSHTWSATTLLLPELESSGSGGRSRVTGAARPYLRTRRRTPASGR